MKTKKFKLSLNKETVSNLNIRSMANVRGGAYTPGSCEPELCGGDTNVLTECECQSLLCSGLEACG